MSTTTAIALTDGPKSIPNSRTISSHGGECVIWKTSTGYWAVIITTTAGETIETPLQETLTAALALGTQLLEIQLWARFETGLETDD